MRKRNIDERGQALVIVVLAMVGLIGLLSLIIDGGMAFAARRQMQNAADAGALAAVRKLYALYEGPHDATDEQAIYDAVIQYAVANGVADPTDVEAWFINDSQAHTGIPLPGNGGIPSDAVGVEVTTSTSFDSFFATVIGRDELAVSALAASILTAEPCAGPYAVWADSCDCGSITVNCAGSDITILGSVHSNDGVKIQGSASDPAIVSGAVEYCGDYNLSNVTYDSLDPWPPEWCDCDNPMPKPWDGLNIIISRFQPGGDLAGVAAGDTSLACQGTIGGELQTSCYHYFSGNLKYKPTDDDWLDGLYYVEGDVTVNGKDLSRCDPNITIVATGTIKMVNIDGSSLCAPDNLHFVAYSDLDGAGPQDLLFFSNQNSGCNPPVINISSSAVTWTGIVFAPDGRIDISGSDLTAIEGAVWGYTVNLSGAYQSIGWTEDSCGEDVIAPDVFLIR